METFYTGWEIADAKLLSEAALPRPLARHVGRLLAERRECPVVVVVDALAAVAQPELLETEEHGQRWCLRVASGWNQRWLSRPSPKGHDAYWYLPPPVVEALDCRGGGSRSQLHPTDGRDTLLAGSASVERWSRSVEGFARCASSSPSGRRERRRGSWARGSRSRPGPRRWPDATFHRAAAVAPRSLAEDAVVVADDEAGGRG